MFLSHDDIFRSKYRNTAVGFLLVPQLASLSPPPLSCKSVSVNFVFPFYDELESGEKPGWKKNKSECQNVAVYESLVLSNKLIKNHVV
jgi:hypothetical protein